MEHHGENHPKIVVAVVPARYASVRLPGKMLLPVNGRPLILQTVEQVRQARSVSRVIVATDDRRIFDIVTKNGCEAMMTSSEHRSGTDRVAEVAESIPEAAIIVNVQGDEPLISPETIDTAVGALVEDGSADMSTTSEPIQNFDELLNGNVVKVVVGDDGHAIYFSRSAIPFPRDASLRYSGDPYEAVRNEKELLSSFRKHTGLYVYRREYLLKFSKLPPTKLEQIEMLEQLRALEDGAKIRVVDAVGTSIGVDTQEDLDRACRILESGVVAENIT
ncbi:MAG TPA: 3-deoxy-manno-octulosonate cytidylyltransferase [Pyrinomonadaceae bacterium]|nr:3-deoxy-manno-octulosonate cytidylyltransferase [Pyrinomonadaceae bacterium]